MVTQSGVTAGQEHTNTGVASRAPPVVQEPAPLMSRRKLEDLLKQIDPDEKLDPAVEQVCL